MIDLHCHILPGIDDGPATIEESVAMARAAHAAGTRAIVATPHVSWRYANESHSIARLVERVNARLEEEGVGVKIHAGAEVAMTRVSELGADELARLTLGGGRWLLLEPPFTPVGTGFELAVAQASGQGHRIVLAHPERCPAFHRDPHALRALVQGGALTSITAGSLTGRFGGEVRRFALALLEQGLVHNVASDAHDVHHRPPSIAAELREAGAQELAQWLTEDVPQAILSGTAIPARPPVDVHPAPPPRRRLRWLRR